MSRRFVLYFPIKPVFLINGREEKEMHKHLLFYNSSLIVLAIPELMVPDLFQDL